ncbi:MAG: hypothetical protein GEV00_23115 [Actinophytocola sp.]|nr:hypothetical protein [Actinophytocola sp.]
MKSRDATKSGRRAVAGVPEVPTYAEAWRHFRWQSAYGLVAWLETLGLGDFQDVDSTSETVRRFAQAAEDHGLMSDESLWSSV